MMYSYNVILAVAKEGVFFDSRRKAYPTKRNP